MKDLELEELEIITVPASVLGDMIGVSNRRVRQLAQEGILVRAAQGRYKLFESLKNYTAQIKVDKKLREEDSEDKNIDLMTERALHERVKREKTEMELRKIDEELHLASDVEQLMTEFKKAAEEHILPISNVVAQDVLDSDSLVDIETIIGDECRSALVELSSLDLESEKE